MAMFNSYVSLPEGSQAEKKGIALLKVIFTNENARSRSNKLDV